MAYIPQSTARYTYGWTDFTAADPALSPHFDSGNLVATGANAGLPDLYNYSGGYASVVASLSPHAQHLFLSASAPTLGGTYPDAHYPANDITGTASASVSYDFIDVSAPVTVPVTAIVTYNAHVLTNDGNFDWSVAAGRLGADPNTIDQQFGFIGGNIHQPLSGSFVFTLTPGHSLVLDSRLDASVGSIASTRAAYPTATGLVGILDASNTAVLTVQEIDALGNPIAGNPDLVFLSGASYLDAPAAPPVTSVPEPSALVLVLTLAAIVWLLRRPAPRRDLAMTPA